MKLPALLLFLLFLAAAAAGPLTEPRAVAVRKQRLREKGGNSATEKAVHAGLTWLAKHQSENGIWDADGFMDVHTCGCDGKGGGWHGARVPCGFDMEVTALATLAFLGAGHTHRDGVHKETVARALSSLRVGGPTLFATAFSTQALAEAFDMTGDESLKARVERGIEILVGSRKKDGGWRYYATTRMASGVPTTVAVVAALRTAERAGFTVEEAYKQPVLDWLNRLQDKKTGRVKYTLDAHRLGYTPTTTNAASALLIRTLLSRRADPLSLKALAKRRPRWSIKWKRMKVKGVMRDVQIGYLQHYYWWYGSEALARVGGEAWKSWNAALKRALLPKQRKDGHTAGSWDPAGTYGKVAGRVYSTALCTLMLEMYYRVG